MHIFETHTPDKLELCHFVNYYAIYEDLGKTALWPSLPAPLSRFCGPGQLNTLKMIPPLFV